MYNTLTMSVESVGTNQGHEHAFTLPNGEALPLNVVLAMQRQRSGSEPAVMRENEEQDGRTYFFPEEHPAVLAPRYVPHAGMLIDHPELQPEAKVLRDKHGRFMKRSLANAALHFSDHPHAV